MGPWGCSPCAGGVREEGLARGCETVKWLCDLSPLYGDSGAELASSDVLNESKGAESLYPIL